ncbi:MAG: hypothetical protein RIG62_27175 [Cyclobacteriaceae bacterium]
MDNLSPDMLIVPMIALTLVAMMYAHFLRKVTDRQQYQYLVLTVAITAFILNFIWEVAQGPLYKSFQYDGKHISFCALAAVADMFMVLVLLLGFGFYNSVFWIKQLNIGKVGMLILVGGIGAILSERWHTARGDWSYDESMPLLPGAEVGLSPVLQFAILPLVVFLISRKTLRNYNFQSHKR